VHTLFERDSCKMVRGVMVLMRGVCIGTLYKFLGNVNSTGCNSTIIPEVNLTVTNSNFPHLVDLDHVMAPKDGTYWGKGTLIYAQQRYGQRFP
jgi:hypothetical protein